MKTYTAIVATLTLAGVGVIIVYGRRFMKTFEEFRQVVDQETTRIAGVVEKLLEKANTPQGLSDEEKAEAEATVARLRAIGADPDNPVPDAPPAGGDANPNPGTTEPTE
ncbi:MAG TPA: hypothetical protein VF761_16905 [Gemmatimonadaceae bacterium]